MMDEVDAIEGYYRGQNQRPRFLGRNSLLRFRIDNGVGTVKVEGSHLALPRIGRVRMKEGLRWPGQAIRECRIREHGGRWYASVRVEIEEAEYTGHCGKGVLGIDLGLKTFATIAYPDGTVEKVQAPEPLKGSIRSLRRSQRKLARRKVGSNNRAKARRAVGRRHRRTANIDGKYPPGLPAPGVPPHHGLCCGNPGGGCVPERLAADVGTQDVGPGSGGTPAPAGVQGSVAWRNFPEGVQGLPVHPAVPRMWT